MTDVEPVSLRSESGPPEAAPMDRCLQYCARAPGAGFLSTRASAVAWARNLGKERVSAARSLTAESVKTYSFLLAREKSIPVKLSPQFKDLRLKPVEALATGLAASMGRAVASLDPITASYWLSTAYTAMLPAAMRARLGIYYTPPELTSRLLDMAVELGADMRTWRVLDPACGGGAFMGPVALRMARSRPQCRPSEIIASIADRLRGFEVDPFAAWLSQVFIEMALAEVCAAGGTRLPQLVKVCDSLKLKAEFGAFNLVVGNPPYGRVGLSSELRNRYRRSLYGHANLYGVFTDLALRWAKPGGLVAFVTPTSFLAGQYFKALRSLLSSDAPPAAVDVVEARQGVFEGVLQETMLAVYRRGGPPTRAKVHRISYSADGTAEASPVGRFELPKKAAAPWLIPRHPDQAHLIERLAKLPSRLADWGYKVSTGPLVWNRHKSQLRRFPDPGCAPLVWAEAIAGPGKFVFRAEKKNHEPYFKLLEGDEWLCIDEPCVLLQRTTAKEQRRRLVAATLPSELIERFGSVVVENHLNMVRPLSAKPKVPRSVIAALLNSEIVDSVFRCISGSVAVSAFELESLPLPSPTGISDLEQLVLSWMGATRIERSIRALYLGENAR